MVKRLSPSIRRGKTESKYRRLYLDSINVVLIIGIKHPHNIDDILGSDLKVNTGLPSGMGQCKCQGVTLVSSIIT